MPQETGRMATDPQVANPMQAGARKTNPLLWILLGVAALIVFASISVLIGAVFVAAKVVRNPVAAAASLLASTNKDVEIVSRDDAGGTITVRDKSSGKTVTMNVDELKRGRISFSGDGREVVMEAGDNGIHVKSSDGTAVDIGRRKLPDWVPSYPGASVQGSFSSNGGEAGTASIAFTTKDSAERVLAFYGDALKKAGLSVTDTPMQRSGNSSSSGSLAGVDDRRNISVNVSAGDDETTVGITYSGR